MQDGPAASGSGSGSESRQAMVRFLKRYTPVSDAFVDDFFGLADPSSGKRAFVVNAGAAAKWLNMTKGNFVRSLRLYGFEEGVDYNTVAEALPADGGPRPRRRPTKDVRLTTECFKGVCMMLNTAKSKEVRAYFMAAEETLLRYREELEVGLKQRIAELERNQRGPGTLRRMQGPAPGVIYVIRAAADRSVYKVGRTKDLAARLRSHEAALADGLDILFIYKTQHMAEVEGCVKAVLRSRQYKKYKEVYATDLDSIKEVITECDDLCTRVKPVVRPHVQAGGSAYSQHFIVLHKMESRF
jgi:phage anti-repressor protein